MKKKLVAMFGAVALLAIHGAALAQDQPVQLKLSHWVPPSHPLQPAFQAWAKSIADDSHGSITITIYPAQQLGKAFDHYDMARDGIADITDVSPGYQPGRFPIFALGSMPFLVANAKGGSAALDEWYRKYAPTEMKDVHFCSAHFHDPGTFHSTKQITVPADIKGLKVRVATDTIGRFVTSLGGTTVNAAAPEARDVIARGVADAITFPWGSMFLFGIDKVVKYHLDMPFYVTPFVDVMNKAKYDSLSPAQKKVIDDHCTSEWAEKLASPWADFESAGRAKMKAEAGHVFVEPTPEQVEEWRKAAEPLKASWAEDVKKAGGDPDTIYAEFEAALKKHGAAY
jgi:TRAP-type C4-dicarboxylate transport system substrate-binding protein